MSLILSASGFENPFIFTTEIDIVIRLHNCFSLSFVFKLKQLCRRITVLTSIVNMFANDAQAYKSNESYEHSFPFFVFSGQGMLFIAEIVSAWGNHTCACLSTK